MKKKLVIALLPLFLIAPFVIAGPPQAPPPGQGMSPMMGGPSGPPSILNLAVELNLSGEQFEKLKALEKESKPVEEKFRKETIKNMDAMRDEMDKDKPSEEKLDAIIEKIAQGHKQMLTHQTRNMLKMKSILTKQQQKMMKDKMESKMKDFKPYGKGGRPMPPGDRPEF